MATNFRHLRFWKFDLLQILLCFFIPHAYVAAKSKQCSVQIKTYSHRAVLEEAKCRN